MRKVLQHRQRDLTIVCENIHDPHNVSAILRSCDAVGVARVHLLYTDEPFPQLGRKTSASARKWIDILRHTDYAKLQAHLKKQKMTIYATYVEPAAKTIYEIDWTKPAAIVLGNEHRGVSDDALAIADQTIRIPMFGMVESLNVSVAAAVILYEACRQRLGKKTYQSGKVDEWLKENLEQWLERG